MIVLCCKHQQSIALTVLQAEIRGIQLASLKCALCGGKCMWVVCGEGVIGILLLSHALTQVRSFANFEVNIILPFLAIFGGHYY